MWATYILLYIWVSVDDIGCGLHQRGRGGKRRYSHFINHTSYITPLGKPPTYISPLPPHPTLPPSQALTPHPAPLSAKADARSHPHHTVSCPQPFRPLAPIRVSDIRVILRARPRRMFWLRLRLRLRGRAGGAWCRGRGGGSRGVRRGCGGLRWGGGLVLRWGIEGGGGGGGVGGGGRGGGFGGGGWEKDCDEPLV